MVIHFRINFEIADNRANDLVVGTVSPIENLQFPLQDGEQLFNVTMLLGQALNDHDGDPNLEPPRNYPDSGAILLRQINLDERMCRKVIKGTKLPSRWPAFDAAQTESRRALW